MIKAYKIDRKAIWTYLYKIILITFSLHFLTALILFNYKKVTELNSIFFILFFVSIGWFLFFILPLLILFLNHRKRSKSIIFEINGDTFSYKSDLESIEFNEQDIAKIEITQSAPSYDRRIDFLYFGKYFYTTIYTNEENEINISCLVCDQTMEIFRKDLILRKRKVFPVMK